MSLKKRLKKLQGISSEAEFTRKHGDKIPKTTLNGYLSGKRKHIKKGEHRDTIAAINNVTPLWVTRGSTADITKTEKEDLLKIYDLDPEVIDVETEDDGTITPVVRTYDDGDNLYFYCIHCGLYHRHGRGGSEEETPFQKGRGGMAGDRFDHCFADNSPYKINGYILDVVGREEDEPEKKEDRDSAPLCPRCRNYYSRAFGACQCGFTDEKLEGIYPEIANIYLTRITKEDRPNTPSPLSKPIDNKGSDYRNNPPSADTSTSSKARDYARSLLDNLPESRLDEAIAALLKIKGVLDREQDDKLTEE